MGSFGERLRREREMRGISLDDIAEATKIGTRLLRALEEEHFDILPGGIFNKGFVRAYAKYLGLNEDEAVADYLEAAGESTPDPRVIAEQNASRIDRTSGDGDNSRRPGFPIIPVLILLLFIAAGAGGWQIYQERVRNRQAKLEATPAASAVSPAASTGQDVNNPATAATTPGLPVSGDNKAPATNPDSGTTTSAGVPSNEPAKKSVDLNASGIPSDLPASQSIIPATDASKAKAPTLPNQGSQASAVSPANAQPFEVTVRAKDRAWVSIKSDGKFAVRGIISPPDVKTIRASDQVVFWTGNAGAVDISFNGQEVPLPGGPNSEGVLVFNSHGVVVPRPALPAREP